MTEPRTPTLANPAPVPPRRVAETDWVSAHIFYQGDLTELLVDGVVPLVREMVSGGLASGWFFLRYWDGGTHLRLRVLQTGDRGGDAARTLIIDRLGRYLRERPSVEQTQPDEYARLARVLAAREGMASFAESMYPNNTVVFLPYRREHGRYGSGGSVEAVERHFVESSRLAAALLEAGGWPDRRDTVAFSLILLTWLVCQPDPSRLAGAGEGLYQAWGRGLDRLADAAAGGDETFSYDADFDERYRRQRDRLVGLARGVQEIAACLPREKAVRGVLARWGTSVLRLRDALAHEVSEGRFTPPALPGSQYAAASYAAANSDDLHARVLPVLDICAHLLCNRLGISLVEESYLRYLAARSAGALAEERN